MQTPYSRLRAGSKPAAGILIEYCRSNMNAAEPTIVEQFTADGEWITPATSNGFYYRATTTGKLEASIKADFGV